MSKKSATEELAEIMKREAEQRRDPHPREIIEEILREDYNLSGDQLEKAAKEASAAYLSDGREGWEGAREEGIEALEGIGVDFGLLEKKVTAEMAGLERVNPPEKTTSMGPESYDGLIRQIEEADADPGDLLVVTDPEGKFEELANKINEAGIEAGEVAVGRRDDIRDAREEKESLRAKIADEKGLDPTELEALSLPSLRSLAGTGGHTDKLRPSPESGDIGHGQGPYPNLSDEEKERVETLKKRLEKAEQTDLRGWDSVARKTRQELEELGVDPDES